MSTPLPTDDEIKEALTQWEGCVYEDQHGGSDPDKLDKARTELLAVLRRLREAAAVWISVDDQRPPESFGVLAWITGGTLHQGEDYIDVAIYLNGIWRANVGDHDEPIQVSHWMYKPESPAKGNVKCPA